MIIAALRQQGLTTVKATCRGCGREGCVDVSALPAALAVAEVGSRLRCAACDSRDIATEPNWAELGSWRRSSAAAEELESLRSAA